MKLSGTEFSRAILKGMEDYPPAVLEGLVGL